MEGTSLEWKIVHKFGTYYSITTLLLNTVHPDSHVTFRSTVLQQRPNSRGSNDGVEINRLAETPDVKPSSGWSNCQYLSM